MLEQLDPSLLSWSRLQFALTACYHWLFVPLTLGLSFIIAIMETLYVVKKDVFWKKTVQFWMKLFGINFAIGVATGLILEFEFGTNWSNYSWFVGDIFGAPLAIEGIVAFFMESTFIAVMFFGWEKVSKRFHLISTWLVAIGASLSAWWILVANSWMQHPVGMTFNPATVRNEMMDFFAVAFSKGALVEFIHTILSGWVTGAVFVAGISAWYLLKKRHSKFSLASMKIATIFGLVSSVLVALAGDHSGVYLTKVQPMKLAAMEGLYKGGEALPLSIIGNIEIPYMLSVLATHDPKGYVPGVEDVLEGNYKELDGSDALSADEKIERGSKALSSFKSYRESLAKNDTVEAAYYKKVLDENLSYFGYGFIKDKSELIPHVPLVYWTFRVMVGLGLYLIMLFTVLTYILKKKKYDITKMRWLLIATIIAIPFAYIAGQAGWIVTEVGRQPWAIQGLLPVSAAVSDVSAATVKTSFFLFLIFFTTLLIVEINIMLKAIRKGPDVENV